MVSSASVDVVIVGAGLSGLQAAVDVQKAGYSCLVLEATERIGGKVFSVPIAPGSKSTVDLGAAWVNDTSQSRMWALGQKYGMQFQKQLLGSSLAEFDDGSILKLKQGEMPLPPEHQEEFLKLVGLIYEVGKKIKEEDFQGPLSKELDQITLKRWILDHTSDPEMIVRLSDCLASVVVGVAADECSALYMLAYIESATGFANIIGSDKDGGQYLRPHSGTIGFVNGLASELKPDTTVLGSPVTSVTQHKDRCVVTAATGTKFHARKVIVAVPVALQRHINFEPKLPASKSDLMHHTKMGSYTKITVQYSIPWWRTDGLSGSVTSTKGPINTVLETSVDVQHKFCLSLFICGPWSREWSALPPSERKRTALDHLQTLYKDYYPSSSSRETDVLNPLHYHEKIWEKEMWFEGAPTPVFPPGLWTTAGQVLCQPVGDVHFAGTETSPVWPGYMEGAVRSGERAACEVVEELKKCT